MLSITVTKNDFGRIADRLGAAADNATRIAAHDIQAHSMANTTRVDTGAMKNGWMVDQLSPGVWIVWNTQFYAVFHELGTYKLAASPMLVPAVETVRRSFGESFWAEVADGV